MSQTIQATNWIGPRELKATDRQPLEDRNPADRDDLVAVFPSATAHDAQAAIEAAAQRARDWKLTPAPARGDFLRRAADILEADLEENARLMVRENGKTVAEARGEVRRGIQILRYFAGEGSQPWGQTIPSTGARTLLFTLRDPVGVVGVLTPWNFPLAIPLWKIAPALVYGNTVVFKPAEQAPLSGWIAARALRQAGLPDGVLNLVTGQPETLGGAIVDSPQVAAVTFTGSNAVGRAVQRRVHDRGAKVQLEMGGKNPTIVLEDADLERAVRLTLGSAMRMAGQKCTATSRAIVLQPVFDRFREAVLEGARALKLGNPLDEDTYLGPLITEEQRQSVLTLIQKGQAEGGRLLLGGDVPSDGGLERGHFVRPTLFDTVEPGSTLGQTEIFGPVLALMPAQDFQEAIHLANSVPYGLSASIVTNDLSRVLEFVRQAEVGVVKVNSESAGVEYQAPFGGMKASGSHSREQGKAAIEFFTQVKTVYVDPLE